MKLNMILSFTVRPTENKMPLDLSRKYIDSLFWELGGCYLISLLNRVEIGSGSLVACNIYIYILNVIKFFSTVILVL